MRKRKGEGGRNTSPPRAPRLRPREFPDTDLFEMTPLELPPPMLELMPGDEEEQEECGENAPPPPAPKIRPSVPPTDLFSMPLLQLPPAALQEMAELDVAPAALHLEEAQSGFLKYLDGLSTAGVEFNLVEHSEELRVCSPEEGEESKAEIEAFFQLGASALMTPMDTLLDPRMCYLDRSQSEVEPCGEHPLKGPRLADETSACEEGSLSLPVPSATKSWAPLKSPLLDAWRLRAQSSCSTCASTTSLEHSPRTTLGEHEHSPRSFWDLSPLPNPVPSAFLSETQI